ncbi:hypothetical protein HNV12_27050 [Methanococcoides sp. SA1]|nr:hypothetical protein [Methanococcoides sp. SA1]
MSLLQSTLRSEKPTVEGKSVLVIKVVSVIHKWPYEEVYVAYSKLFEYISEHSLMMSGPARSIYLNDTAEVTEDELLTEVQIPVNEIRGEVPSVFEKSQVFNIYIFQIRLFRLQLLRFLPSMDEWYRYNRKFLPRQRSY